MKQYANVSNTNSKLGGQILSINMPAGITCRPDAPCYTGGTLKCTKSEERN